MKKKEAKNWVTVFLILSLFLATVSFLALTIGSTRLSSSIMMRTVLRGIPGMGLLVHGRIDPVVSQIIWEIRMPRIILAILVGSALSAAGLIFQGLFRNPLADPYIIGASSGASLGASLGIVLGWGWNLYGINSVSLMAFAGTLITTILVYHLAKVSRGISITTLLLAGVAVSSFFTSIVSTIMMFHHDEISNIMLWLLGGFTGGNWNQVEMMLPYLILGFGLTMFCYRELDMMLLGEERALQLGVNTSHIQKILVFSASLLVASAVSAGGLIGFIGLVVPHIMRLMVGPKHRYLMPFTILGGGFLLLIADTISRTIIAPRELPVGIVTAFLGAPFFIFLLKSSIKRKEYD